MDTYYLLLMASGLVILSHIFFWISNKTKIPSVLLLMALGVFLHSLFGANAEHFEPQIHSLLEILGILGLIFIVLEGSLGLSLKKSSLSMAAKAFSSAFLIFAFTAGVITEIFVIFMDVSFQSALAYAIPLSIISSAIAIPTALHLTPEKREFVVYESTFSDIIGILVFGYVIMPTFSLGNLPLQFATDIGLTFPIAIIFLILMLWLMHFSNLSIRLIPILAIVVAVFATTKILHLPALLLILAFGMLIKNLELVPEIVKEGFDMGNFLKATDELKTFITEISFLVRTFFFIVFGYTLPLEIFSSSAVLVAGSVIFLVILAIRLVSLKYIIGGNFIQELLLAPRGLVTIILFFSIPDYLHTPVFNEGIVYYVIIISSLVMMGAFLFYRKTYQETVWVSRPPF